MSQQQQQTRTSDVIMRTIFSGFNKPKSDPVNETKESISKLETDRIKNNRALSLNKKELDKFPKKNLTQPQKDRLKPLLAERKELMNKSNFIDNSILLLRKTINVHEITKDTQVITSNINNLNIATRELNKNQSIGNVDNVMSDLSELLDDTNDYQEALTTNSLTNNYDDTDLLNEFINEDDYHEYHEEEPIILNTPVLKKPLIIQSKNVSYSESNDDYLFKELETIKVPQTKLKFNVINNKNSTVQNDLGWDKF